MAAVQPALPPSPPAALRTVDKPGSNLPIFKVDAALDLRASHALEAASITAGLQHAITNSANSLENRIAAVLALNGTGNQLLTDLLGSKEPALAYAAAISARGTNSLREERLHDLFRADDSQPHVAMLKAEATRSLIAERNRWFTDEVAFSWAAPRLGLLTGASSTDYTRDTLPAELVPHLTPGLFNPALSRSQQLSSARILPNSTAEVQRFWQAALQDQSLEIRLQAAEALGGSDTNALAMARQFIQPGSAALTQFWAEVRGVKIDNAKLHVDNGDYLRGARTILGSDQSYRRVLLEKQVRAAAVGAAVNDAESIKFLETALKGSDLESARSIVGALGLNNQAAKQFVDSAFAAPGSEALNLARDLAPKYEGARRYLARQLAAESDPEVRLYIALPLAPYDPAARKVLLETVTAGDAAAHERDPLDSADALAQWLRARKQR